MVVAAVVLVFGCGSSQTRFLHQKADLGAIKSVAVFPLENLTEDRSAGDKVLKVLYLELLATEAFEVAEPGQVAKLVKAQAVDGWTPADYQKLGNQLGVDAIFTGTVIDFAEGRSGSAVFPEVSVQLRLVETTSGATIWSSGRTKSGAPVSTRLFGFGGQSLTEAAREVVRSLLSTLFR